MSTICDGVLTEYLLHYNAARPHRALGQLAPAQADTGPPKPINLADHRIRRKQVLGGLTHEYQIAADGLALLQEESRSPSRSGIRAQQDQAALSYTTLLRQDGG